MAVAAEKLGTAVSKVGAFVVPTPSVNVAVVAADTCTTIFNRTSYPVVFCNAVPTVKLHRMHLLQRLQLRELLRCCHRSWLSYVCCGVTDIDCMGCTCTCTYIDCCSKCTIPASNQVKRRCNSSISTIENIYAVCTAGKSTIKYIQFICSARNCSLNKFIVAADPEAIFPLNTLKFSVPCA